MSTGVYDDEDTLQDLERMYHGPDATESGSQKLANSQSSQDGGGNQSATSRNSKARNSGGRFHNPTRDQDATRSALKNKEANAGGMNYTGGDSGSGGAKKKVSIRNWKKPTAIFGSITGLLVGGGIFGAGVLSGPAHLIQNGHVLQGPSLLGSSDSSQSWGRLFRWGRALRNGTLTETRLNKLGSNYFAKAKADLAKNGVTISEGRLGIPTRTDIDINKLKDKYPELKSMKNDAEVKRFLADKLDISADEIKGSGTSFSIDHGSNYSVGEARALAGNTIANLGDGKGLFGMKAFAAFKAWRLPLGVFHPLDRAAARAERSALLNGKPPTDAEKAASDAENAKVETVEEPLTTKGAAAVDDIKASSAKFNSVAMKALLFTGGVCMVREIADKVITVNHYQVALPAAAEAMRGIAAGEEVQYGSDDVTWEEMGVMVQNMGPAYESAQAYEALSGGQHHTGDPDIDADYQQAFSTDTTAGTIRKFASLALGGDTVAGAVCSPIGIGVQIVGGLALSIGSVVAEVGSVGTLTPGVVGIWAAKEGVSFAVSAVAMHFIEKFILSKATVKLAADAFKGPAGANLVAYGARELANIAAMGAGAVDLGNKASTIGLAEEQQAEMQQFRSENFFARMFSPYDSHSLLGHFMLDISPSFSQNMMSISGSIINVGGILPNLLSNFSPKADAALDYKWTFGQMGIPSSIKNDPNLQDPYANGDAVASLFDSSCKGDPSSCDYAKRIKSCWGNSLSYSDGVWDVTPTDEVDEHSDDYLNADCNKIGTPADTVAGNDVGAWRRIIRFVSDTSTMKQGACYFGSDEDCPDHVSAPPASATDPSNVDQSTMYLDSSNVPCATGTKDLGVHDGYHSGQKVPVRLCALPNVPSSSEESHDRYGVTGADGKAMVNSRVSANFFAMATNAASAGRPLAANSSFRSMEHQTALCNADSLCSNGNYKYVAKPGTSNHQMGLAIDFDIRAVKGDTNSCVGRAEAVGDKMWDWLNDNAAKFGIRQYANESWHWETSVKPTDCGGDGSK